MIKMASSYAPSILVLEDIDNGVGIHRNLRDHPILGEFLNSMDGISRNNGIFTIASTNYLDRMDPALKDRPGRFCRVIQVPVPNQECRHRLLSSIVTEFGVDLTYPELTSLSKATDGLTGDWLRETARTAELIALEGGRDSICYDDLKEALRDVNDNRGVAHLATPELEPPVDSSKISDVYI
jgi:ATP-dependent 26S proteasome regulatory subunit